MSLVTYVHMYMITWIQGHMDMDTGPVLGDTHRLQFESYSKMVPHLAHSAEPHYCVVAHSTETECAQWPIARASTQWPIARASAQ
jgi:hypothetical protein